MACLKQRTVPARQDLIQQGTQDESLYFIARGKVRVLRLDQDNEREIAILGPGDFVGDLQAINIHNATCRAFTPCAIYELTRRDLERLRQTCSKFMESLEQAIAARV